MKTSRKTLLANSTIVLILGLTLASARLRADTGTCGGANIALPLTDVAGNAFFCQIAASYFSGLMNTYGNKFVPEADVSRDFMATFITRTLDQSLKRGSRRAAFNKFWTPTLLHNGQQVAVGNGPIDVVYDGGAVWVANTGDGTVSRVRASDGKVFETYTGAPGASAVCVARGKVFVAGGATGKLYSIRPEVPPFVAQLETSSLDKGFIWKMAYDGSKLWTVHQSGKVNIVSFVPGTSTPSGVKAGADLGYASGIVFDGSSMWVAGGSGLNKLDANGAVIQSVPNAASGQPAFDGTNIWSPFGTAFVTVVRASTGELIAKLTGNGLEAPRVAAFDGERIAVTNYSGNSVSLFNATSLAPSGFIQNDGLDITAYPKGICSDGLNFWVTLSGASTLVRY